MVVIDTRGLKSVLFLSVDDNHNMKRTAKIAFFKIKFTDSITYITSKFYKYANERNSTKLASVLHELYSLKTTEEFKKISGLCLDCKKILSYSYHNNIYISIMN